MRMEHVFPTLGELDLIPIREQKEAFPLGDNLDFNFDLDHLAVGDLLHHPLLLARDHKQGIEEFLAVIPRSD